MDKIQEWQSWINEIFNEVHTFYMDYSYYKQVRDIWSNNSDLHKYSSFIKSYIRMFEAYAVAKIRKQLKPALNKKPEKSLAGLLVDIIDELKRNPGLISRKSKLEVHRSYLIDRVSPTELVLDDVENDLRKYEFTVLVPFFSDKDYIDVNLIIKDHCELKKRGKKVETYADKINSHSDLNSENVEIPTYKDLENTVDYIFDMANKYSNLLTGSVYITKDPSRMNLSNLFKIPWIKN